MDNGQKKAVGAVLFVRRKQSSVESDLVEYVKQPPRSRRQAFGTKSFGIIQFFPGWTTLWTILFNSRNPLGLVSGSKSRILTSDARWIDPNSRLETAKKPQTVDYEQVKFTMSS